jgi:hypothetical protein
MRWADITAFFTASLWFGSNVAFAIVPMVMFHEVRIHTVDATRSEVGELFGQVALRWGTLSLVLLAILAAARLIGWALRLRHRRFTRWSLVGVAIFAGIAVFTVLADRSYVAVEERRAALEDLDEDSPQRPAAAVQFEGEHQRSVRLSKIVTGLLLAQAAVLAVSLARRPERHPSASAA